MNLMKMWPNLYFAPDGDAGGSSNMDDIDRDLALLEDFPADDAKDKDDTDLDDVDADKDVDNADDDKRDDKSDKDNADDDKGTKDDDKDTKDDDEDKEDKDKEDDKDKEGKDKEIEAKDLTAQNLKSYDKDLFKHFPELKEAIFVNKEYNKLFGSIEEAADAKEKAETLDQIAETTLQGDPTELVAALEKTAKGKVEEFTLNLLEKVRADDEKIYYKITDPIIAQALRAAKNYAAKRDDKQLDLAIKYVSRFLFDSPDVPSFTGTSRKEKDPEILRFEEEKERDRRQKMQEHENSVYEYTERKLGDAIREGLDPQNVYNEFIRTALTEKIMKEIGRNLASDKAFQGQMSALWKRSLKDNFSRESKAKIAQTYLAKARRIMPTIRAKVRSEAGGADKNKNGNQGDDKRQPNTSTGRGNVRRSITDAKKIDWKNKTDEEILAED